MEFSNFMNCHEKLMLRQCKQVFEKCLFDLYTGQTITTKDWKPWTINLTLIC